MQPARSPYVSLLSHNEGSGPWTRNSPEIFPPNNKEQQEDCPSCGPPLPFGDGGALYMVKLPRFYHVWGVNKSLLCTSQGLGIVYTSWEMCFLGKWNKGDGLGGGQRPGVAAGGTSPFM